MSFLYFYGKKEYFSKLSRFLYIILVVERDRFLFYHKNYKKDIILTAKIINRDCLEKYSFLPQKG
jgi:hypothetical protein